MEDGIVLYNEEPTKLSRKKLAIISIVGLVVLLIVIGVSILIVQLNSRRRDVVKIANYDDLDYVLPDATQEEFGGYLYNLLRQHFEVPEDGSKIVANIRPETYEPVATGEVETVKFTIDVEDYKQSYDVVLSWSNYMRLPESARIECTTKDRSNYPGTPCHGMNTTSESVEIYLPHTLNLKSGQKVELEYGMTTSDGNDIIRVVVASCGDKSIEESAMAAAKEWIQLEELESEGLVYKLMPEYENCVLEGSE